MQLYAIGDRVTQAQYGDGTVMSVDAHHTRIEFDVDGLRTFSSPRVTLSPATTMAPVKPAAARRKRVAKDPNAPKPVKRTKAAKSASA
jgi:hypothetical protein